MRLQVYLPPSSALAKFDQTIASPPAGLPIRGTGLVPMLDRRRNLDAQPAGYDVMGCRNLRSHSCVLAVSVRCVNVDTRSSLFDNSSPIHHNTLMNSPQTGGFGRRPDVREERGDVAIVREISRRVSS